MCDHLLKELFDLKWSYVQRIAECIVQMFWDTNAFHCIVPSIVNRHPSILIDSSVRNRSDIKAKIKLNRRVIEVTSKVNQNEIEVKPK